LLQTSVSDNNNKITAIIPDSKWPTTGLIRFDNVQLKYKDNEHFIFDNICFTITNAEKIGKSIINLTMKNHYIKYDIKP
jgi:ABC-type multidrug transport system fused ATPase/permease subunit